MRRGLVLLVGGLAALGLLAGATFGALTLLRDQGGFWHEAWRLLFGVPPSLERWLMAAAVVLAAGAFLLTPITLVERRSERAFERRAGELRRERPEDAVTTYAGAEGEGLSFDGPAGRVLLLRGANGVGEPVVVDARRPDAATLPAERPSPEGSYGRTVETP